MPTANRDISAARKRCAPTSARLASPALTSQASGGKEMIRNSMWVRLPAHTPPVESRGPRSHMAAAKKAPRKAPTKAVRSRRPATARGPEPRESVVDATGDEVSDLVKQVQRHGGAVVGAYRGPLARQTLGRVCL